MTKSSLLSLFSMKWARGSCPNRLGIRMLSNSVKIALIAILLASISAPAQTSCASTKLICLIPTALHTNSATFSFVNTAFGTQIGQLPLATPASGFIFTFDKPAGVYTASQESFGPLLAERAETIGRHRVYLAFTYQRFMFSEIDGNDLKNIPILFSFFSDGQLAAVTDTRNRLDTTIDQYVAFGTFGLTNRIDVSLAVPIERISMGVRTTGTEYSTTSDAQATFSQSLAGSASGVGDVVLSAKGTLYKHEKLGLAAGMELRFPTGEEENFLGSGAYGIKPYIVLSRRGRIAPHLNLNYQWNGNSLLARDQNGEQRLPAYFGYTAGADIGVTKRLTLVADLVGQYFLDAPQVSTPRNISVHVNNLPRVFSSVEVASGSYNVHNLGVGVKANPWQNMLVTGNVLIKLDCGGVRARVIPLVGISYSF